MNLARRRENCATRRRNRSFGTRGDDRSGRQILFDTGQGEAFLRNAEAFGIDPGQADTIVLSRDHYDHRGGLPQILGRAGKADLYCHPAAVSSRFKLRNGTARYHFFLRIPSLWLDRFPPIALSMISIQAYVHNFSGVHPAAGPCQDPKKQSG